MPSNVTAMFPHSPIVDDPHHESSYQRSSAADFPAITPEQMAELPDPAEFEKYEGFPHLGVTDSTTAATIYRLGDGCFYSRPTPAAWRTRHSNDRRSQLSHRWSG